MTASTVRNTLATNTTTVTRTLSACRRGRPTSAAVMRGIMGLGSDAELLVGWGFEGEMVISRERARARARERERESERERRKCTVKERITNNKEKRKRPKMRITRKQKGGTERGKQIEKSHNNNRMYRIGGPKI